MYGGDESKLDVLLINSQVFLSIALPFAISKDMRLDVIGEALAEDARDSVHIIKEGDGEGVLMGIGTSLILSG